VFATAGARQRHHQRTAHGFPLYASDPFFLLLKLLAYLRDPLLAERPHKGQTTKHRPFEASSLRKYPEHFNASEARLKPLELVLFAVPKLSTRKRNPGEQPRRRNRKWRILKNQI